MVGMVCLACMWPALYMQNVSSSCLYLLFAAATMFFDHLPKECVNDSEIGALYLPLSQHALEIVVYTIVGAFFVLRFKHGITPSSTSAGKKESTISSVQIDRIILIIL